MNDKNIDICAIQETRKKGKGHKDYNNYILIYSGVKKEERARAGVGILIHKKFRDHIDECQYVSERIVCIKITMDKQKLNVVSIYSPENCKPREERENFYEQLQTFLDTIPPEEYLILMGDFNARIGREVIPGVKQRFNEDQMNENGELMTNFCSFNELRINNSFFDHKNQYKYTFENSRGQRSMIDYIVTNRKIHPMQILDVRTLNSADLGDDNGHKLVLGKIRMEMKPKRELEKVIRQRTNIESLWDDSTKGLYQDRISQKLQQNPTNETDDINESWNKIKTNIQSAALEALGTRTITSNKGDNKRTPWFTKEVKDKCKEKRKFYLQYRSLRTQESRDQYKLIRNETNLLVRRTKDEYWEQFSKRLESDFYGAQKQMWRFLRKQRKEVAELTETNKIPEEEWERYLTDLFKGNDNINKHTITSQTPEIREEVQITYQEVEKAIKSLKNRKSPGQDGIPNELLKYGGDNLIAELTKLIRKIIAQCEIPDAWRNSTMIPMFKKGDKKCPNNYRGINLLDTTLKLTTKIITNKINTITSLSEEQQGFRSGRSCVDAVFILRQVVEKSIEYNKPAYLCFIDLQKAFDRIQLQNVIHLLYNRDIPINIVQTIENIYLNNKVQARINNKLTNTIPINSGIRQGDSLSPLLFNIVMDNVIKKVREGRGYKMGDTEITILCYADDAVLLAESEDDLQRLVHTFNTIGKEYNMIISTEKTICMTIAKEPIRCKIEIDGKIIQQEQKFRYLGIDLSSYGDVEEEVRQQVAKASKIAGCLNNTIWKNKHLRQETKSRIYKATVRPIMTYTSETRPDTAKTRRLLETTEMRILRNITGKTLLDRERSENIRKMCKTENINEWVLKRKQEWNSHINRMTNERLVRIARDKSPVGKRSIGRPRKRWSDNLEITGG